MSDSDDDSLAGASLQHALMNETKDYLERGRRFAKSTFEDLNREWVAAFNGLFVDGDRSRRRDMDDAAAEIRLRGREPPYDTVRDRIAEIQDRLARMGPDHPSEELDRLNEEFSQERGKPKH
jgi:hypothetical protein